MANDERLENVLVDALSTLAALRRLSLQWDWVEEGWVLIPSADQVRAEEIPQTWEALEQFLATTTAHLQRLQLLAPQGLLEASSQEGLSPHRRRWAMVLEQAEASLSVAEAVAEVLAGEGSFQSLVEDHQVPTQESE